MHPLPRTQRLRMNLAVSKKFCRWKLIVNVLQHRVSQCQYACMMEVEVHIYIDLLCNIGHSGDLCHSVDLQRLMLLELLLLSMHHLRIIWYASSVCSCLWTCRRQFLLCSRIQLLILYVTGEKTTAVCLSEWLNNVENLGICAVELVLASFISLSASRFF